MSWFTRLKKIFYGGDLTFTANSIRCCLEVANAPWLEVRADKFR